MKKLIVIVVFLLSPAYTFALPAFPGAEGWGKDTVGGRSVSAKLYKVNTLSDSNSGSGGSGSCSGNICAGDFRYALQASGYRFIIFTVAGTIALQDDIWVGNGNVTVAGQASPGTGIQIRNGGIKFEDTNQVIVRGLKIRPGDSPGGPIADGGRDGMTNTGSNYVIFDHNTMNFSCDTGIGSWYSVNHVTFSYNLLAYALNNDCSDYDAQLMLIGGPDPSGPYVEQFSVHHNLYAHSNVRAPGVGSGTHMEALNNVIYNINSSDWASWTSSKGAWIGNYWKNGPLNPSGFLGLVIKENIDGWDLLNPASPDVHISHSICPDRPTDSGPETNCLNGATQYYTSTNQLTMSGMTIDSPTTAYTKVLGTAGQGAGAYQRDSLESTVISNVLNGTGPSSLCATEECYGGYPTLSGTYPTDTDGDGMPDAWESANGTNPSVSDWNSDLDGDGYLNIEEYINSFFPVGGDTTPPQLSGSSPGSLPSGTTQYNLSIGTNENATCKYDNVAETTYANMPNTFSTTGGVSHSSIVGSTTYTDNFDRANENPLGNGTWTKGGSNAGVYPLQIVDNTVKATANTYRNSAYYSSGSFASDQYSKLTVSGDGIGPMVRMQPGGEWETGYVFRAGTGTEDGYLIIRKHFNTDSTHLLLSSTSGTVSDGDILEIRAVGNSITAYKNGSEVTALATTDSEYSGGYTGIFAFENTAIGYTWEGGGLNALADGQNYCFYSRCLDGSGNANQSGYPICFNILTGGEAVRTLGSFTLQGAMQ